MPVLLTIVAGVLAVFVIRAKSRTPGDIVAAVREIDPEHNAQLQRGAPPAPEGGTWCNKFIAWVTSSLGSPVPFAEYGTHAYAQIEWLAAGNDGWRVEYDEAAARLHASKGGLAIATSVSSAVPGGAHLALVLPNPDETRIAQAGAHCFNDAPLRAGFGGLPVTYYLHE